MASCFVYASSGHKPGMRGADLIELGKQTYAGWQADKAPRLAAALSYYTIFALAPLLIIVIQIAALVLGAGHASGHHQVARDAIFGGLQHSLGVGGAKAAEDIVDATLRQQAQGLFAAIIGWIVLAVAAAGLVGSLQDALDTIWEVEPQARPGILGALRARFVSFAMIAGIAFVLLVSLAVTTGINALSGRLLALSPALAIFAHVLDLLASLAVVALLFAAIFKFLPQTKIEWSDVRLGAGVTALLFVLGQLGLGWYLGRATTASAYGAAGSLIVILLWVFYSAQILLMGAELTKQFAHRHGSRATGEHPSGAPYTASRQSTTPEAPTEKLRP